VAIDILAFCPVCQKKMFSEAFSRALARGEQVVDSLTVEDTLLCERCLTASTITVSLAIVVNQADSPQAEQKRAERTAYYQNMANSSYDAARYFMSLAHRSDTYVAAARLHQQGGAGYSAIARRLMNID
jgi:hypothetical protein